MNPIFRDPSALHKIVTTIDHVLTISIEGRQKLSFEAFFKNNLVIQEHLGIPFQSEEGMFITLLVYMRVAHLKLNSKIETVSDDGEISKLAQNIEASITFSQNIYKIHMALYGKFNEFYAKRDLSVILKFMFGNGEIEWVDYFYVYLNQMNK